MDGFRAAVYTRLHDDATLVALLANGMPAIYHRRAPLDASFPLIIFQKQSGTPIQFFGGQPIANQVWMFKGVDRASAAGKVEDIDKRINAVLTDAALTLSDGTLLYLRRESDIDYEEGSDPNILTHHVGGLYRTVIDRN